MNKLLKSLGLEPKKFYPDAQALKSEILNDNRNLSGIYKWTNIETRDSYVGSGIDLAKRIRSYYQTSELNRHPRHINRALLKHGHDKFKLEILEYCDKDKLMEREQFYLDEINPSYNILKKAYSMEGFKHSAETIEQLKDREFTQEHKDNLAKAREGREFSEETLKKLSESLSKHHKEHPLTPEAFENIKRKTTEREGVPVALINKDTGEETQFETQTDAANFLGITRQAIKKALDRDSILSKLYKVKRSDQNNNNTLSSIDNNSSSGDSNSSSGDDGED
uniref:GIY-YIG endonuclease n=1 Tax=Cordyceps cicadae TaxID=218633 RepID=A0A493R5K8_9HYPO|nr:GIY-YIG endonuclease [Cordyceps cicadae]